MLAYRKLEPFLRILRPILPNSVRRVGGKGVEAFLDTVEKPLFGRHLSRATPVLIYQMGKVGSTSISHSLLRFYPGVVIHAHRFSPEQKDWKIRRLYRWALLEKKPLAVISLTREPIGRNISAFFQRFRKERGVSLEKANLSFDELRRMFLENFVHTTPLEWFDKNIRKNFGIDVYATPFPECGFAQYSQGNIKLLVMRSEISDREKTELIKEFLGLRKFQLLRLNVGDEKEYAETYAEFRSKVKLPSDYVTKMCESRYFNHFYSRVEIERAKKRWSETVLDPFYSKGWILHQELKEDLPRSEP